jgi:ribosomal protein S2
MILKEKQRNNKKLGVLKNKKVIRVGDICELKISALGLKNIGIDEYSLKYSVLVPNANLGETIKAKILKIAPLRDSTDKKYAIAKKLEVIKNGATQPEIQNLVPGEVLEVNIQKLSTKGAGIVELANNYKLIIPNATVGQNKKVMITRIKLNYGFAKMVSSVAVEKNQKSEDHKNSSQTTSKFIQGSKFTLNLPKNAKQHGKYLILKLNGSVVFVKLNLRAKLGNKVRIKLTKVKNNFAIAKIVQINPSSSLKKQALIKYSIRQMINNGMHFGEKAVKCHAKMKNYIWLKKQGQNKNRALVKKGRHVINLLKTRRCLNKALAQLSKYAVKGRTFLFIGTKKPAAGLIARASLFSKTSFFVNTRWLGGMLTNWKTILKSISKIRPILKEKQKIVRDILEKRQDIKSRLIKKALLLKNKTKLILNKGRLLIKHFKNNPQTKVELAKKATKLSLKRKEFIQTSHEFLEKRQVLLEKRRELMIQSQQLKDKGIQVTLRYNSLLNQLTTSSKKLKELKYLLILSKEIKNIKKLANQEEKNIFNGAYGKLKELNSPISQMDWVLPNPPKDILSRVILTIYSQSNSISNNNESELNKVNSKKILTKSNSNKKVLVLSKLMSQFSSFAPYIKSLINVVQDKIKMIENLCQSHFNQLKNIKTALQNNISLKNDLIVELSFIKTTLNSQRNLIRLLKTKLKHFATQKKFLKLLSRLKKKQPAQNKITDIVQTLMKKIVDPKLKYPIDNIYDEKLSTNSKKLAAARKKKWQRLEKYFGGIANMTKMSKTKIYKNVAIIVGQKEEINAVRECQKLGIKMFNIVDTNCNPTFADHIIPANDDSRNSIKYILNKFLIRIRLAQKIGSLRKKTLKLAKH